MNEDYPLPNPNFPLAEDSPTKRIPLSERTPRANHNAGGNGAGGVTVTPHTGQLKKLGFSPADGTIPEMLSTAKETSTESEKSDIKAHEYGQFEDELENLKDKKSLDLPGITARSSRFSRTSKLLSKVREGKAKNADSPAKPVKHHSKSTFRKLVSKGWIPNQHGAYMMMLIPPIVGIILSHLDYKQLLFLALWISSYFTFFSFSRWAKSGGKERYFPPVKIYGIISAVFGSICIALMPPLLPWAIPFIPVVTISIFEAYKCRSESLLARSTAVISAGLSGLVSYDIGVNFWHPYQVSFWIGHEQTEIEPIWVTNSAHTLVGWDWALMVMFYLTIYFWSTILFVKTLAREKNSFGYYLFSVASHSAILFLMGIFAVLKWITLAAVLVWFILSLRSIIIPLWNRHSKMPVPLKQVGMIELIICLIVISAIFT